MKLRKAKSVGKETIGTMHGPMTQVKYKPFPNGQLLDDLRRALEVPIYEASKAVKIKDVDWYGIRQGRLTFSQDDFVAAVRALITKNEELNPQKKLVWDWKTQKGVFR